MDKPARLSSASEANRETKISIVRRYLATRMIVLVGSTTRKTRLVKFLVFPNDRRRFDDVLTSRAERKAIE